MRLWSKAITLSLFLFVLVCSSASAVSDEQLSMRELMAEVDTEQTQQALLTKETGDDSGAEDLIAKINEEIEILKVKAAVRQEELRKQREEEERLAKLKAQQRKTYVGSKSTEGIVSRQVIQMTLGVPNSVKSTAKYLGRFKLTFYCPCVECSEGYDDNTSTGVQAQEGVTVAVDPTVIPYGTRLYIDGFGYFIAQDCGGAIKQNRIDIYVVDHDRCNALGVKYADVYSY